MSPFNFHYNANDEQHLNKAGSDLASASQSRYNSLSGPSSSAGSHAGSNPSANPRYNKKQHFQEQQKQDFLQNQKEQPEKQEHATHHQNTQRQHSNQGTHEKINILSLEEIEMIFNSLHSEIPPIWSPVPTSNLEKIVYYNKNFNIYCNQLPLIQNPSLDIGNNFKTDDNMIDLYPRDLQNASKYNDKTFKLVPLFTGRNSVTSKTSSASSSTQVRAPPINADIRSASTSTNASNCFRVVSESLPSEASQHQQAPNKKHVSAPNLDTEALPPHPGTRKLQSISSNYNKHSHRQPQAILSKPDLFYHHTMDIKLWSELRDTTLYYATKSHEMILKSNRAEYDKFFQLVSAYLTYSQMACRLSYAQIKEKQLLKEVKRLLKKIITSLSKISINSSIYFGSFNRHFSSMNDTPRPSQTSLKESYPKEKEQSIYEIPSINDTETLVGGASSQPSYINYHASLSGGDSYPESYVAPRRNNSATTTRTSIPSTKGNSIEGVSSSAIVKNLHESLDNEFNHFIKAIQMLYFVLQTSILSNDWIPQLFPRFFKGSFNGGSWTNPFNHNNQPSGSVSSQSSFLSGLPSKVADAIAGASGCAWTDSTELGHEPNHSSSKYREKSVQSSQKTGPFVGFNRPSHHRTFSRSKASRKVQYPLNENTITLMKKRYNSLCEKLGSIKFFDDPADPSQEITSKKKQLEVMARTYEEVSSCVLLEILENLDLGIFVNLKTLIATNDNLDPESEEFLRHALSTISSLLTEFFDIKQLFHDSVIRLIMCAQQITLDDPYVFCSMKSNFPVGYFEPGLNPSQSQFNKIDKAVTDLYSSLITKDVEINDLPFLRCSAEFVDSCTKYTQMGNISCTIVEQLVEERENLLNYAARMMKNDLTTELLKGEQEKWFEDYEVFEQDDTDENYTAINARNEEFQGSQMPESPTDSFKDKPWFLHSVYSKSLIYDQRGRIKGGTRDALVEHLTSHEVIDAWFNVTMLMTFRSMFTTRDFLYALVYRYNLYPPEGLSYDEYNLWIEKKLNPIKSRVINIMRSLFSQYWSPAYYEPGLSATINFAQMAVSENQPGAQELYDDMKEYLATNGEGKNRDEDDFKTSRTSSEINIPSQSNLASLASSSSIFRLKKFKLLDISARTYASQLALMEHALYIRIPFFECLDRAWGTKYCDMGGSPNITRFITSANNLTNYVSHAIVKEAEVKKRAALIQYFITVAQYCRELNNFSAMTAIVSALCSSPIYRLKRTWPLVSTECTVILKELNSLMDSTKNFINYRELARSVKDVPCVPFFGVYLSDLTFTFGGNPDFLHGAPDVVNFSKRARIVDILEEIMSFKRIHYKLKRYDDIQAIIESSLENVPHIEKQYELSLLIEPRANDQGRPSGINPMKSSVFDTRRDSDERNGRMPKLSKKKHSSRFFG